MYDNKVKLNKKEKFFHSFQICFIADFQQRECEICTHLYSRYKWVIFWNRQKAALREFLFQLFLDNWAIPNSVSISNTIKYLLMETNEFPCFSFLFKKTYLYTLIYTYFCTFQIFELVTCIIFYWRELHECIYFYLQL